VWPLLFGPPPPHGPPQSSGIIPLRAEAARSLMALWSECMLERPGVYPPCSYEACYEGIQVVGHEMSDVVVLGYRHGHGDEMVISHILMCKLEEESRQVFAHGIVENPDNIHLNKSIIPMMQDLRANALRSNYTVEIAPLMDWAYGVYHFALVREL